MPSDMERLKLKICSLSERKYCVLTGRATTGIYLLLKALGVGDGEVVFPGNLCPSPVNAAVYCDASPVFCDVKLTDATMSPNALERLINKHTKAIVPIHLYGHPAEMDKIIAIAESRNIPVIEDVAQALGGSYRGKPLGSFGVASVFSFGYSKIIDAGEGGAIVTDDYTLANDLERLSSELPMKTPDVEKKASLYARLYKTVTVAAKEDVSLTPLVYPFPHVFKDIFLYRLSEEQAKVIMVKLDTLKKEIKRRHDNYEVYQMMLKHPKIINFEPLQGFVPWRYSFLVDNSKRQQVIDTLLRNKLDVSIWYPTIYERYPNVIKTDTKNSNTIGAKIINLWVNGDLSTTCKTAECVLSALE